MAFSSQTVSLLFLFMGMQICKKTIPLNILCVDISVFNTGVATLGHDMVLVLLANMHAY